MGIFGGQVTDEREMQAVESDLKSLHVKVAQSAVDSAPTGDQSATYQDANIIAQRFHSAGVNEVVAVGTGSLVWPEALQAEQSTFNPAWVATNESSVEGAIVGSSLNSTYLKNMVTSSAVLDNYQTWHQPADQQCYQIVRKAYPSDKITQPTNPITGSDQSFFAIQDACDNLAMFTAIAKAAGKDLTRASFIKAGYGAAECEPAGGCGAGLVCAWTALSSWTRLCRPLRHRQELPGVLGRVRLIEEIFRTSGSCGGCRGR